MRIDAHQHFWRYRADQLPWIGDGMERLQRDFLPSELEPTLRGCGFQGSIAVQARPTLEETRWLLRLAAENAFVLGVVGWADLCSPDLPEVLAELTAQPGLVGIRHLLQDEPDDRYMLQEQFQRGLETLADHGLAYDLLLHPRHLPVATELVRDHLRTRFILDHLAKPPIRSGDREPWSTHLASLAKHPNVACKMSGLVTEADWQGWRPEQFAPYLRVAWEAFGEDRVLFGSDWPVCLLAGEYDPVHALVRNWAGHLNAAAQIKLFGLNASHWYGLEGRA